VEFLLIAHPGAAPLPINKGASGGELSRIMLAIEVTLAGGSPIPTYVFDEVDVGVGGKAAVEVGRRLALLARHAQVLVVTHLPQVAAWADTHFMILKSSTESVTSSDLVLLEGGERAKELARMMAGREESPLAREHAQELLDFVALERSRSGGKKSGSGKRA
jgi:DNA repair protein RecN (Recombination protein N)